MLRFWFVLVCILFTGNMRQANADERSGDRRCKGKIKAAIGEQVNLVSEIERLTRCHFVSTDENTGEKCCYTEKGKEKDCTDHFPKPNGERCLKEGDYNVTNDGKGTETCSLTIESVSDDSAGHYQSYNANDELIQECDLRGAVIEDADVKVTGEGPVGPVNNTANSLMFTTLLPVLAVLLIVAILITMVILVRQGHIKLEDGGTLTFEWRGRSCSLQLKKREIESIAMEEGMDLRDPRSE